MIFQVRRSDYPSHANKMARIIWAMLVSGELYRQPQVV
jgi:hypothetical protein